MKTSSWIEPPTLAEDEQTAQPEAQAEGHALPVFFYDGTRYLLDIGDDYSPMNEMSVKRHLKRAGLKTADERDDAICDIQTERLVHFAGPLAGYQRGLHEVNGRRLLATSSPNIIKASPGEWPTLRAVIEGLLRDPEAGEHQIDIFYGWLKFARESLTTGRRRPGQALALCGPRGCGKSLLLDITEAALGGRRANPYSHFTGKTGFNADIAGAELLAVDDEAGSTDLRARKLLAANIKSNLFSGSVRIEGKHRQPFQLAPCWRMILAVNDEPEALLVLPPISEDVADKIILAHCHRFPLPMPAHTMDERSAFFARLMSELPAFVNWLEAWQPPADIREERCGVTYYHHPALLAALHELSPEGQLAELIDTAAARGDIALPWEGTASVLKAVLLDCPATRRDAERLLANANTCGKYLGRLEGKRVVRLPLADGIQPWRIV